MEDEEGYMSIDPKLRNFCATKPSTGSKGCFSNLLWWKIGLGISVAGNVALILVLILLNLPALQDYSYGNPHTNQAEDTFYNKPPHNLIQSCLQNCIPCRTAKDSITANLTLDPDTAFPKLFISEDKKSVKWKDMKQNVAPGLKRYDVMASVLTQQGFTSGKICWEVEIVEGGQWWGVGVVRESANRNGPIVFDPSGGYWAVQRIDGKYEANTEPRTNLSLCHQPKRIRISLDYLMGQVAFFDGDTHAELFIFPKTTFSGEKIFPWFLIHKWNGELMIHP
ncbi:butyrophilin subfamily 1 member A1 isoform X2 [Anolis carolinensis]|uniref:butyrophilin subfamily 1 member A1 isoform X2 n=1 Tax=Anolis carolinensis TaxID=28377 RepID=UPI000462AF6B|nr:PREDICTED: butyrophilin subfamily 1 member A1 isoform X2 [Anolis carolinensis]|eukprot:XP_008118304.1 PREDICTED: butyrophilin subfamily 1 member A1 isoform X2 [Anolis carolinensis]